MLSALDHAGEEAVDGPERIPESSAGRGGNAEDTQAADARLGEQDRKDYGTILESLRKYVSSNNGYWKVREVPNNLRFQGWYGPDGKLGWDQNLK